VLPCPRIQCAESVNAPNHQNTIIVTPLQQHNTMGCNRALTKCDTFGSRCEILWSKIAEKHGVVPSTLTRTWRGQTRSRAEESGSRLSSTSWSRFRSRTASPSILQISAGRSRISICLGWARSLCSAKRDASRHVRAVRQSFNSRTYPSSATKTGVPNAVKYPHTPIDQYNPFKGPCKPRPAMDSRSRACVPLHSTCSHYYTMG
jgi:hypothetical protein